MAVNVTDWPKTEGAAEAVTVVVVSTQADRLCVRSCVLGLKLCRRRRRP